jgi:hypothetical protein
MISDDPTCQYGLLPINSELMRNCEMTLARLNLTSRSERFWLNQNSFFAYDALHYGSGNVLQWYYGLRMAFLARL